MLEVIESLKLALESLQQAYVSLFEKDDEDCFSKLGEVEFEIKKAIEEAERGEGD